MISEQTVIVVGASGFIGRHTITRLAKKGYNVYATHRPVETPSSIAGVVWIPCDLTEPEATAAWPKQCNSLIYLAQSSAWRDFPGGAADVFEVNVVATFRTAEYARKAGVTRYIYASSGSVYTQTERPAKEDEPFLLQKSRRLYDASKLASELMLGPYDEFFHVVITRLFVPYGAGQDAKMLIPQLVQRVRQGEAISLHGTDGLLINPVAVRDVAETLVRCLALQDSVTMNVAGPERLSLREIGEVIGRVLGKPARFSTNPEQAVPVLVGDTRVMETYLDWSPQTKFEEGLRLWLDASMKRKEVETQ